MASPSELSLECRPQSYSMLLKSFGEQIDHCQTHKLEEFLACLEEERLKIDAFKRELPLCMQLLNNAMEASRQQLQAYRSANQGPRPILEEFIPLKHSTTEDVKPVNISDKANWMTSAQLWSQASDGNKQQTTMTPPRAKETDIGFNVTSPKLGLDNKQRNGGAFLPFTKERNLSSPPKAACPNTALRALPELALASNDRDMEDKKYCENENNNGNNNNNGVMSCNRRDNNGSVKIGSNGGLLSEQAKVVVNTTDHQGQNATNNGASANGSNSTHRKARRCWSPDLHRRFVNALQMLGGSQVATPKQIRELMKVDGLTNDEVKSHLQKYRLHTRRPSPSPQAAGGPTPQLVVLGGIWVPPDYAAAAAAAHGGAPAATLYGPHPTAHPPPHFCAPPPVPQEYYAAAAATPSPAPGHHEMHHSLHHPLHVYKATTAAAQAQSSPQSGLRGAGDRSESIEDGKSESNSWKGDSSENNGAERKGLTTAMRDDNEESNGSEITLKF